MKATPYPVETLLEQGPARTFSGPQLLQIAMPLGGIGAGCVCLNGHGGLQDFSIYHQPATSALADGHNNVNGAFALLRMTNAAGLDVTRLVEGPLPVEKIYDQGLKGQGYRNGGYEGLPRFRGCTFQGEYPFGVVTLSDPKLPLVVEITGWNPFIPLDDRNSSLPCAILEYRLTNTSGEAVEYALSYHLEHLASGDPARHGSLGRNAVIPGVGVFLYNVEPEQSPRYGSVALGLLSADHQPAIKAMWYRGGWFDAVTALWREVSEGRFEANDGANAAQLWGRNGGSVQVSGRLAAGEAVMIPFVIAWHFPNVPWGVGMAAPQAGCDCPPGEVCPPCWRPYYAGQWADARAVLEHVRAHYADLRRRTLAFKDALFGSSLPAVVIDAISANLAILKSPTVLRQENGNVWGWEGCFTERGCCHGTCTHVWNYAQAMAHLFPALERTLREQELMRSMAENGHVTFRAALPDGPTGHDFHAAADGQLGGVMKVYREWQISGDRAWLEQIYPRVKRSMDYCIEQWDPARSGLVVEPHHNTYDIEFWGPDGMISSFYLGALAAMGRMAREIEGEQAAAPYEELAARGAQAIESLYNGEYYEQRVMWEGLRDTSLAEKMAAIGPDSTAEDRLLKQEGPKYQYGSGCLADGVLGAWMARRCGVESPQNQEHILASLKSIFGYNFKESLWEQVNPQRPGYAIGDEPGLLLCTWPRGGKPTFPFPYSDEVWTGIEYQAASHMIEMGMVAEGLTIVKAARSRYEGHVRNPWNEYECGNYYARAMASYALLEACTGFRYSAVTRSLHLQPRLGDELTTFFSTASGWGVLKLAGDRLEIDLREGELALDRVTVVRGGRTFEAAPKTAARAGEVFKIALA